MKTKILLFLITAVFTLSACSNNNMTIEKKPTHNSVSSNVNIKDVKEHGNINISIENWNDYFELKSIKQPFIDQDKELVGWDYLYGIFLKPKYEDKYKDSDITFEVSYDRVQYKCKWNDKECILFDKVVNNLESNLKTITVSIEDLKNDETIDSFSPFYNKIAGVIYGGSTVEQIDGSEIANVPENGKILKAEGFLILE